MIYNLKEMILGTDSYFVWGAGVAGRRFVDFVSRYVTVKAIIDNDVSLQGKSYLNYPIVSLNDVIEQTKITPIICAVQRRAKEVTSHLDSLGIPYIRDLVFITAFMYYKYNKMYIEDIDICFTNRCQLNCANCCHYVPYYDSLQDMKKEDIIQTLDFLFNHIDYIQDMALSGGDPLLHPEFNELLEYIADKYIDRIENISIMTTGLLPKDDHLRRIFTLVAELRDKGVKLSLSGYTENLPQITNRRTDFINLANEIGAEYYENSNAKVWYDFGNPYVDLGETAEQITEKFKNCRTALKAYQDKLYLCAAQTNARLLIPDLPEIENNDYFDLRQTRSSHSESVLFHMVTGIPQKGYLSFCRRCYGFFNKKVPAAIQKARK